MGTKQNSNEDDLEGEDEPRKLVRRLRDFLLTQSAFESDLASQAATALTRFLQNEVETLDHAFGFVAAANRPPDEQRRFQLAVKIALLRESGRTWDQIEDDVSMTERAMRRLVQKFEPKLMAQEIVRRLNAK